jgi:HK97 family phage major capsid protein
MTVELKDTLKSLADAQEELRKAASKFRDENSELHEKLLDIERRVASGPIPGAGGDHKTPYDIVAKSAAFEMVRKGQTPATKIDLERGLFDIERKTAIVNATGQNQPLAAAMRVAGIVSAPQRRLTIRDLLANYPTSSNLIEYTKENVYTDGAGPQYGSPDVENVALGESGITFTLANSAVVTIGTWIPVSAQVLNDAPMLQAYLNQRLTYHVLLEEEDEILNGDGTQGKLSGILKSGNYTAYSGAATGDTKLDTLRRAIFQVQNADIAPSGVVLNPADSRDIDLLTDDNGNYIFRKPAADAPGGVWNLPAVVTKSIASGTFLVGAFASSATVWDRQQAAFEVSNSHSDYFVKNMVALRALERLALTIEQPAGFVSGSF